MELLTRHEKKQHVCLGPARRRRRACTPRFSRAGGGKLDPLIVAGDTHKLVLENAFVRVIESKVPAGKLEAKHKHPHGLTVYLANYKIEQKTFPDGKVTQHERKLGMVNWSESVVHEVRNIGKTPSHAIRIELKH